MLMATEGYNKLRQVDATSGKYLQPVRPWVKLTTGNHILRASDDVYIAVTTFLHGSNDVFTW